MSARWGARGAAVSALVFAACANGGTPSMTNVEPPPSNGRPAQPDGWDQAVTLPTTPDLDPTPNVVEINLEARVGSQTFLPGTTTPAWTYNGAVPGPFIRAHVGDTIIAHFTNNLPDDSTVHWHGIRLTSDMDGVPGHTQPPVHPGGSFDYTFTVPDAGLFWYHPHVDSAQQVGDGLYGAILVEDPAKPDADQAATFGDDLVLVLSDIDLNPDGSLGDPNVGGGFGALFGREGNTLLVNGKVKPTIRARTGLRQRWRIVNSAKSRFYQLALDGHSFTLIGVDGGLIPAPIDQQKLVVVPGGRADVVFEPKGDPGTTATVMWVPYDRGYGTTFMIPSQPLFDVAFSSDAPYVEPNAVPATLRAIEPLDTSTSIARSITLTQDTTTGDLVLGINGVPASMAKAMPAKVGTTEVWTVKNTMQFDHPFHMHGFFFQPLDSVTGAALPAPQWLDTYDVPQMQTVQFAIKYDDRPGMWMFHCHILDHADAGMMGMIQLAR
jgi:FtsP/CotA-like multicopper oxidase with cupredoxin domain